MKHIAWMEGLKLERCPHCGGDATISIHERIDRTDFSCGCVKCKIFRQISVTGPIEKLAREAVDTWNRRTIIGTDMGSADGDVTVYFCRLVRGHGDPGLENGKCAGFAKADQDEPPEDCKACPNHFLYDDAVETRTYYSDDCKWIDAVCDAFREVLTPDSDGVRDNEE